MAQWKRSMGRDPHEKSELERRIDRIAMKYLNRCDFCGSTGRCRGHDRITPSMRAEK